MSWMIAIDREDASGKLYREGESYDTHKEAASRIEKIFQVDPDVLHVLIWEAKEEYEKGGKE